MIPNPPRNFLIVDDNVTLLELLIAMFSRAFNGACDLYTTDNGFAAVQMAKEFLIDCALLDMQMPGMNGVQTLRELKKANPQITVMMMTGAAPEEMIEEAIHAGAIGCLTKPFTMEQVKDLLNGRGAERLAA